MIQTPYINSFSGFTFNGSTSVLWIIMQFTCTCTFEFSMFFEPIKIENYKHLNFEFKVHVEFTLFNFSFDILI